MYLKNSERGVSKEVSEKFGEGGLGGSSFDLIEKYGLKIVKKKILLLMPKIPPSIFKFFHNNCS